MNTLVLTMFLSLPAATCLSQSQVQPPVPQPHAARPSLTDSALAGNGYRIGAEDTLQITVWKEPTLSGPLTVRPDGMISLVLLGDVSAAGFTPEELAHTLQTRLKKYIQDPLVTVVVSAALSQKVYVMGEVSHPGQLPLTPSLTLLQAIAASGGLSPYANAGKIYILRTANSKQIKINLDYRKALKGEGPPLPALLAGDTIVVP